MSTTEIEDVRTNVPTVKQLLAWSHQWMVNMGLVGYTDRFSTRDFDVKNFSIDLTGRDEPPQTLAAALQTLIDEWNLEAARVEASRRSGKVRNDALKYTNWLTQQLTGINPINEVVTDQNFNGILTYKLAKIIQRGIDERISPPPRTVMVYVVTQPNHASRDRAAECIFLQKAWLPVNITWDEAKARLGDFCHRINERGEVESTKTPGPWRYYNAGANAVSIRYETMTILDTEGEYRKLVDRLKSNEDKGIGARSPIVLSLSTLERFWYKEEEEKDDGLDLQMIDDDGEPLVTAIDWQEMVRRELEATESQEEMLSTLELHPPPTPDPPTAKNRTDLTDYSFPESFFPPPPTWDKIDGNVSEHVEMPDIQRNPAQDVPFEGETTFGSVVQYTEPTLYEPLEPGQPAAPLRVTPSQQAQIIPRHRSSLEHQMRRRRLRAQSQPPPQASMQITAPVFAHPRLAAQIPYRPPLHQVPFQGTFQYYLHAPGPIRPPVLGPMPPPFAAPMSAYYLPPMTAGYPQPMWASHHAPAYPPKPRPIQPPTQPPRRLVGRSAGQRAGQPSGQPQRWQAPQVQGTAACPTITTGRRQP